MGVARRFAYGGMEGLRAGRFDLELNTSAILYRIGSTLVDTGPPNRWRAVRDFVAERPVSNVLLTHHHEDHSGNAERIRRMTGAAVLVHPAGLDPLARGWRLRPYQRLFWGRPPLVDAAPLPERVELEEGGHLLPLHAPGHAEDLVCYLEPGRGWLFTGDLYIGSRPRYLRADECLDTHMESLRKIATHDFDTLFCGHRGVVPSGRRAVLDKLDYLENLCGEARRLRRRGESVAAITDRLLGREDMTSYATLFHFTKASLVRGCLGE